MTHTEAADLILQAANKWDIERVQKSYFDFVAAVATVMDAARADALEEAADFVAEFGPSDSIGNCESASSIRTLAQSHREPKP